MSRGFARPLEWLDAPPAIRFRTFRRWMWVVPGVIVLSLVLPFFGPWCIWAPDSLTTYLTVARSLVRTGHFPSQHLIAPPGYSVMLSPILLFWGDTPLLAIRLLHLAALVVIALLTFFIHRRELSAGWATLAAIFVASSPALLTFSETPLSETLFTAILCGWLLIMDRWERRRAFAWWEAAWGGVLCAAILLTRSIGAVVVPISIWVLWRGGERRVDKAGRLAAFIVCAIGPWIAWELRQSSFPGTDSYRRAWTQPTWMEPAGLHGAALYAHRLSTFGIMRLAALKEIFVSPDPFWRFFTGFFGVTTTLLLGGAIVVVAIIKLLRYRRAADILVIATLGLLCVWPYDEGVRLVAPLIPILAAYPLWVIRSGLVSKRSLAGWGAIAMAAVCLCVQSAGVIRWVARQPAQREKAFAMMRQMRDLAAWEVENLPAHGEYSSITPYRDNSKLLLAGASYLSERRVRPIDRIAGEPITISLDADAALVHESLEKEATSRWGIEPCARTGPFAVFVPEESAHDSIGAQRKLP